MDKKLLNCIPKISVVIRKRPLSKKELARNDKDITEVKNDTIIIREKRVKVDMTKYIEEHSFTFDNVFGMEHTNEDVYEEVIRPLVVAAFGKSKVTCFAYGQTGSGKTYTMMGEPKKEISGLYLLAANDIFSLQKQKFKNLSIWVSYYEIYCGKAFDLLNGRKSCSIRVDAKQNVHVMGLLERQIAETDGLMALINKGNGERMTGKTGANDKSSRSHAITQIIFRNHNNKIHGKMSFIDLAGSERGADVKDTNKQTRIDGAEINKSLLALKECIRALDLGKVHKPFRGSKLTLVLKDSFIGNCKTVMIGNISPSQSSCEHTLNTLRYSDRVKELKKGNTKKLSSKDQLAKELMLPRLNKNSKKILIEDKVFTTNMIGLDGKDANKLAKDDEYGGMLTGNKDFSRKGRRPNNSFLSSGREDSNKHNSQSQIYNSNNSQNSKNAQDLYNSYHEGVNLPQDGSPRHPQNTHKQDIIFRQTMNFHSGGKQQFTGMMKKNKKERYNNFDEFMTQNNQMQEEPIAQRARSNTIMAPMGNYSINQPFMNNPKGREKSTDPKRGDISFVYAQREKLIESLVLEEENILHDHKNMIDILFGSIKEDTKVFQDIQQGNTKMINYVESLESLLSQKEGCISILQKKLQMYKEKVKEEEKLRNYISTNEGKMNDVYDLQKGHGNDFGLLEDIDESGQLL